LHDYFFLQVVQIGSVLIFKCGLTYKKNINQTIYIYWVGFYWFLRTESEKRTKPHQFLIGSV
jgi:hypothetical protein